MIVQCEKCKVWYDDEFRTTFCPHSTFRANDGKNRFRHYPESYRGDTPPTAEDLATRERITLKWGSQ